MTLVLSVHSRDSLWLVADRRLSYRGRRPPIDDAVKVMNLETTDGVGLLAYAGLGATAIGTQPSEWMSAVLRGRSGLMFEEALGVLSSVANREMPRHLTRIPGGAHFIIVPAFLRGVGARLYSIDNIVDVTTGEHRYRYTRHQRTADPESQSVRIAVGGTGGLYLSEKGRAWGRSLLTLVNRFDRGRITDLAISDELARMNLEAHHAVKDGSVGPRCVVVWRRRPDAKELATGGGHQFYTGVEREQDSAPIPTIANGMDVRAIADVLMSQIRRSGSILGVDMDKDQMNQLLATVPDQPDERLR